MKIYVVGSSKNKFLDLDSCREKFLVDETHEGDNIDHKNSSYCEITGLYYLWKHCNDDIVGLEHYRRYFTNKNGTILSKTEAEEILKSYDIIMYKWPNESAKTAMRNAGKELELKIAAFIVGKIGNKEMQDFFERDLAAVGVYEGNMFICRKELIDEYCEWLFQLLAAFDYMDHRKLPRIGGYIAEYMFGPWMKYKQKRIYDCSRQTFSRDLKTKLRGHV